MSITVTSAHHTTSTGWDGHRCAQGFCTVCGSVWPCWRAQVDDAPDRSAAPTTLAWDLPRC